jgi:hypothetical protein
MIYEYGEIWQNDIDEKIKELREKPIPCATLSTTNPT